MKQCFTYIDKKQNKTNFNSGQQSPMESKPLPTSDTRQLVYTHPSYALVEEHQFPQGPDIVRCHMMHTHKNKNNNNKKNMHWAWDKKSHSNTWTLALLRWWGIFNAKELFQAWGSGQDWRKAPGHTMADHLKCSVLVCVSFLLRVYDLLETVLSVYIS